MGPRPRAAPRNTAASLATHLARSPLTRGLGRARRRTRWRSCHCAVVVCAATAHRRTRSCRGPCRSVCNVAGRGAPRVTGCARPRGGGGPTSGLRIGFPLLRSLGRNGFSERVEGDAAKHHQAIVVLLLEVCTLRAHQSCHEGPALPSPWGRGLLPGEGGIRTPFYGPGRRCPCRQGGLRRCSLPRAMATRHSKTSGLGKLLAHRSGSDGI